MKRKLTIGFILLVIMIVPFARAYANNDFEQPVIAIVSFLLVVLATMATLFFFLAETKEENAF